MKFQKQERSCNKIAVEQRQSKSSELQFEQHDRLLWYVINFSQNEFYTDLIYVQIKR